MWSCHPPQEPADFQCIHFHGVAADSRGLWRICGIHLFSRWHLVRLVLHISALPPCACHFLKPRSMLLSAAFTTVVKVCQQQQKSSSFLSVWQAFTINLSVLDRILPVKFQVSDRNTKIVDVGDRWGVQQGYSAATQHRCAAIGMGS